MSAFHFSKKKYTVCNKIIILFFIWNAGIKNNGTLNWQNKKLKKNIENKNINNRIFTLVVFTNLENSRVNKLVSINTMIWFNIFETCLWVQNDTLSLPKKIIAGSTASYEHKKEVLNNNQRKSLFYDSK